MTSDSARVVDLMALIGPDRVANAHDVVYALQDALDAVRLEERRRIVDGLVAWGRYDGVQDDAVIGRLIERIERGEAPR